MTIVAIALIERGDELLICRRRPDQPHAGKWEFPGGKVEAEETPSEALSRELREELGIEAEASEELARYGYSYSGDKPLQLVFFRVTAYRGQLRSEQFAALRWVRRAELPAFDFLEGDAAVVRDLAAGRYAPEHVAFRQGRA